MPIVLAGNKSDLPERVVSSEEIDKFLTKNNARFFDTSAKTGKNLVELFLYLAEEVVKKKPKPKERGRKLAIVNKKHKSCC